MKSFLFALTIVLTSISSDSSFAKGKKRVKILFDESYPPYAFKIRSPGLKGNEKAGGFYSAIIRKVFEDPSLKDYKLVLTSAPWKAGLTKMKKGKEIGLYPPYHRPVERPYMNPYSAAILDEQVVLMCRKEIADKMRGKKWPEDFISNKIKVARNRGFSYTALGKPAIDAIESKKWKLVEGSSTKASFMMMAKGRADCYFNDGLSIRSEAKKLKDSGVYQPGGKHQEFEQTTFVKEGKEQNFLKKETGHIGWSKSYKADYKDDLVMKVDAVIKKMRESGEIQKIIESFTK